MCHLRRMSIQKGTLKQFLSEILMLFWNKLEDKGYLLHVHISSHQKLLLHRARHEQQIWRESVLQGGTEITFTYFSQLQYSKTFIRVKFKVSSFPSIWQLSPCVPVFAVQRSCEDFPDQLQPLCLHMKLCFESATSHKLRKYLVSMHILYLSIFACCLTRSLCRLYRLKPQWNVMPLTIKPLRLEQPRHSWEHHFIMLSKIATWGIRLWTGQF